MDDRPADPRLAAFVDEVLNAAAVPAAVRDEAREDFLAHLEADAARRIAEGANADAAVAEAIAAFGTSRALRRAFRDAAPRPDAGTPPGRTPRIVLDALARDAWDAMRALRRRPLSRGAAIATLAVGIGLNAAVFTVVDWVLLRPLPYPAARELVQVFSAGTSVVTAPAPLTSSEFQTLRAADVWQSAAALSTATRVLGGAGVEPAHVTVARVAGDLFATLGVFPEPGRAFSRAELESGARVAIVSHALWRSRLGADAAIVGRTITIDGQPHIVIGVMPAARGYPDTADVWRPLTREERGDYDRENVMIGRLRAGQSMTSASVELGTLARAVSKGERTAWVEDLQQTRVRGLRGALALLWASAALILLMTCANVAALVTALGADRAGELAVRGALGATRGRLVQQLLAEHALLAVLGGAAGFVLGGWALRLAVAMAPRDLPRLAEMSIDARVMLAGVAATALVALLIGLVPAWSASRCDVRAALSLADSRVRGRAAGRTMAAVAQTAVALVLVIVAVLLVRGLRDAARIDHGFEPRGLLAIDLDLRGQPRIETRQLFRALIEGAESVPGVESAVVALRPPHLVAGPRAPVRIVGAIAQRDAVATLRPVSERYFETVGIPIRKGRAFTRQDDRVAPAVAVVNEMFVRDVLQGADALGVTLTTALAPRALSIVGVAADVTPAGEADRAALYVPADQVGIGGGALVVRADDRDLHGVVPALTARLRTIAPALALDRISPIADAMAASQAVARFNTLVASAFAVLALILAATGLYGLTAGEVAARWRELAVRLALGASRREALATVLRPAARATLVGVTIGIVPAMAAMRWLASAVQGARSYDAAALIVVPAFLSIVGLAAAALAAIRVLRADPAETLRGE